MSPPHIKTIACTAALALLVAFAPALVAESSSAKAGETVAVVAGQAITRAELEESLVAEIQALETQRHQLLEAGLDRVVEERLLKAEAARRDVTVEELLAAEMESAKVTDAEIDAWYEENSERVRQPKEELTERIREFLGQQRQITRRQELVESLRSRHGVEIRLDPMRLAIEAGSAPAKGPEKAVVTLIEFSDFQCPACKSVTPAIEQIHRKYGDRVRVAFKQFPLHSIHPQAQAAAEAALCAGDQGQFWEMHDSLFERQNELTEDQLKARATTLGLDAERFNRCLDDGAKREAVLADLEEGRKFGVHATPSLFVNGRPLTLRQGVPLVDQMAEVIDDELARIGSGAGQ